MLSLTWLMDSVVEKDKECKKSRLAEEKKFIFGYSKAKGSVEIFGTYNITHYELVKDSLGNLCCCA